MYLDATELLAIKDFVLVFLRAQIMVCTSRESFGFHFKGDRHHGSVENAFTLKSMQFQSHKRLYQSVIQH